MTLSAKDHVLDLACGQGFFTHEFAKSGADVTGLDISPELIALAKKRFPSVHFISAPADAISMVKTGTIDVVTLILAIQNIENCRDVFVECFRIMKKTGRLYVVMNHPAYRIPKTSSWGFDAEAGIQYRRIDRYMSESRVEIEMHPGIKPTEKTLSFHRPLQYYFKLIGNLGGAVSRLEEWISHKESERGPKKRAEDTSRKEIPLFLCLEVVHHKEV